MTVKRNAYGRQLGSFHTIEEMKGIGKVPMTFIRAPYIESVQDGVDILSKVNDNIIAVQYFPLSAIKISISCSLIPTIASPKSFDNSAINFASL